MGGIAINSHLNLNLQNQAHLNICCVVKQNTYCLVKQSKSSKICISVHINHMGLDVRKPVFSVCEQQRRLPGCASTQSDQQLCYSLIGKYHI